MPRRVPGVLYVALVSLAVMSVGQLGVGLGRGRPTILLAVALNVAMILGLYAGRRWAFVLTLLFSVAGVLMIGSRHPNQFVGMVIGNGFVVVPVLMSARYFWDEPSGPGTPEPHERPR